MAGEEGSSDASPDGRVDRDKFRAPIGTYDILPPDSDRWIAVVSSFAARASRAGFDLVVTPMFEHREVFERVGDSTEIVRKEMYDFEDKGGRSIALRPEGTAPTVRAFVQHRPTTPWKVWYLSPHFRYERPQKGRYRQFWQLGVELIGVDDPQADIEIIAMEHAFYRDLGLSGVRLLINSMGDGATRAAFVDRLRTYLLERGADLGPEFAERVRANPFRVLDSKAEAWQDVIEHAPQITEHLSDDAREHFETVLRGLDALGIDHEITPRLVRGLDYYTRTTFEFQSDTIDAAQNAIGGGGRYDLLAEQMGGPSTPGIGFAIGIDRVLLALDAESLFTDVAPRVDAFVVNGLGTDEAQTVTLLVNELREDGLRTERAYGDRSVKAQWKVADRSGAIFGVMLGRDEATRGAAAVKDLRTGDQVEVHLTQLAGWLQARREEEEGTR